MLTSINLTKRHSFPCVENEISYVLLRNFQLLRELFSNFRFKFHFNLLFNLKFYNLPTAYTSCHQSNYNIPIFALDLHINTTFFARVYRCNSNRNLLVLESIYFCCSCGLLAIRNILHAQKK